MSSERARLTPDGGSTGPLAASLRDELPEARVQRMWQRIDHAPARRSGVGLALATAALVALLLFAVTRWLEPSGAGQLALSSGKAPIVLSAEAAPETPRFEDGSQLTLQKGTRVEVLRNDARSFVTALRRGAVTFDVKPGGKRHWVVEAGELSVEVVGTRFRVEREPDVTRVSVEHGIVMVRGERVLGGSVRLTAGQRFELPPRERAAPVAEPVASVPIANPTSLVPIAGRPPAAAPDPVGQHLTKADDARRRGDTATAAQQFERAWLSAAPGDTRRGLAALSLARLLSQGNPAKAARILRSSLPDMPPALREDAQARLVAAESRAGNRAGAARALTEYRRLFPDSQRLQDVERWSEP